ncbi:MAG TPA: hypothetical protein VEV82_00835 [Actinomycetota bacterium]|nr:hypothetical protein [Actinomycetota bacterium]
MRVLVAGKLIQRSWQDNDGNKRQTVESIENEVGRFRRRWLTPVPSFASWRMPAERWT